MAQWDKIRESLTSKKTEVVEEAAVGVCKFAAENIPDDVVDLLLDLLEHDSPHVRAEVIRAVGLHWCVARAFDGIAERLAKDQDWEVQLAAIAAVGAMGLRHCGLKYRASQTLAYAILQSLLEDFERMVAYRELLSVEGKITREEYRRPDRPLEESLERFETDRSWVERIAAGVPAENAENT